MKKLIQFLLALALSINLYGADGNNPVSQVISELQLQKENFHPVNLFHSPTERRVEGIGTYIHYKINERELQNTFKANYQSLKVVLPVPGGTTVSVLLTQRKILTEDFMLAITGDQGEQKTFYQPGIYYQGVIEGNEHSIAAISFFNNHLGGVISDESGNWNLGPLEVRGRRSNEYAYFNDRSFNLPLANSCGADEQFVNLSGSENKSNQRSIVAGECVRIFIDCDYDFYLYKSSNATAVADYVTAVFNVESILYGNESINIVISEINVWTVADPFNQGSSNANMNSYSDYRRTNFNGDLAQLLAQDAGGLGGIAWIGVLCANYGSTSHAGPVSYCDINGSYSAGSFTFPTYTWDANITSHEMGHNFGSRHTHWCGWSGGPIDNCNTCWNPPVSFDGSCTSGPNPPPTGGTIMSYCHGCSGVGISLVAGFGPQPGNVLRSNVASAICLSSCEIACESIVSVDAAIVSGNNLQFAASDIVYGNNIIQSGANATFTAGNGVSLTPGFNAQSGSVFTARILPCTGSGLSPSGESSGSLATDSNLVNIALQMENEATATFTAYPNPFTDAVTISFSLPASEKARVEIISMEGKLLATLFNGRVNEHEVYTTEFRSGTLESGIYLYRMITASGGVQNKKLLLIK